MVLNNFGGIKSGGGLLSLFLVVGGVCGTESQTSLFSSSECNFLRQQNLDIPSSWEQ